jgi:hypothetical protein
MATLSASIIINRPVHELFSFVSDYHNDWKWRSRRIDFQKFSDGDPAEFIATQKFIPLLGNNFNSTLKVVDFSINKHIISQIQFKKILVVDERYFFSLENHLTRFEYSLRIEVSGILKIFEQLLTRRLQQDLINDQQWLKEMLEKLAVPSSQENIPDFRPYNKSENNPLLGLA